MTWKFHTTNFLQKFNWDKAFKICCTFNHKSKVHHGTRKHFYLVRFRHNYYVKYFTSFPVNFSVDNSEFMRNGDFLPTRLQAQQDAVGMVANSKLRSNPESNVGLLTLSGLEGKLIDFTKKNWQNSKHKKVAKMQQFSTVYILWHFNFTIFFPFQFWLLWRLIQARF